MRTTFTVALTMIAALTLGACSKRNSGGLKARAEVAKAKNDSGEGRSVYNDAEKAIDSSIKKLEDKGYKSMGKGTIGAITTTFFGHVNKEDRDEVKSLLEKIKRDAETQIGLAKKFNDDSARSHAEQTKSNAEKCLSSLAEQENDKK